MTFKCCHSLSSDLVLKTLSLFIVHFYIRYALFGRRLESCPHVHIYSPELKKKKKMDTEFGAAVHFYLRYCDVSVIRIKLKQNG